MGIFLFMIFYYISQSLVSQRIQGIYLFSQLSFSIAFHKNNGQITDKSSHKNRTTLPLFLFVEN